MYILTISFGKIRPTYGINNSPSISKINMKSINISRNKSTNRKNTFTIKIRDIVNVGPFKDIHGRASHSFHQLLFTNSRRVNHFCTVRGS